MSTVGTESGFYHVKGAFQRLIDAFTEALTPAFRALTGYNVIPSEHVTIGEPIAAQGGDVFMHPLDVIHLKHQHDPLARLDEAMDWLLTDTLRKLDAVEQRMTAALTEGNSK